MRKYGHVAKCLAHLAFHLFPIRWWIPIDSMLRQNVKQNLTRRISAPEPIPLRNLTSSN